MAITIFISISDLFGFWPVSDPDSAFEKSADPDPDILCIIGLLSNSCPQFSTEFFGMIRVYFVLKLNDQGHWPIVYESVTLIFIQYFLQVSTLKSHYWGWVWYIPDHVEDPGMVQHKPREGYGTQNNLIIGFFSSSHNRVMKILSTLNQLSSCFTCTQVPTNWPLETSIKQQYITSDQRTSSQALTNQPINRSLFWRRM